ncbi:hypothetical protein HK105_202806 [Polyrhizophydium stewartii]|uniref:Uncharacterized protein n=1 Tax=Polyrhizophydium stewartii TaxID=2732419 RepID=A0ABR4NDD0_9FUNG
MLARRPDAGGSLGRSIRVRTNIFPVTALPDIRVYQYDVIFEPDVPPPAARRAWKVLEVYLKRKVGPKCVLVFDGRKIAFSAFNMTEQSVSLDVPRDDDLVIPPLEAGGGDHGGGGRGGRGGGRGGRGGGRGGYTAPRTVIPIPPHDPNARPATERITVTLRPAATISMHELLLLAQGRGDETEAATHASTALSVALRHVPSMLFTPVGSNFFTPEGRVPLTGGLEVWRGFHQSVRAMMAGHLGINVDVASTVFRKGEISVIDYALEVLGVGSPDELMRLPRLYERLNAELKGVNVVTIHRGDQRQRFKISKLSRESARDFVFDSKDGSGKKSVEQYFARDLNVKLRFPNLPLALKGNGKTAFPLEVLKIAPAQRFMKRLGPQQTADMIRATVQRPKDRERTIQDAVNRVLRYDNNEHLDSFGLKIGKQMMDVPARVLPAPRVVFAGNRSLGGEEGAWNMRGQKLVEAPTLGSYAFIFYVRISDSEARAIADTLISKFNQTGMSIAAHREFPVIVANPTIHSNVLGSIQAAFKDSSRMHGHRCQMMFCVIDKEPKGLYEQIKRITLSQAGVLSQCILYKNVRSARDIKDQYASNLALKVNTKLGGVTNYVDHLPSFDQPTLLFGADVTHAMPGSMAPSIVALVASTDRNATKYHTYIRAQGHRVAVIQDMEELAGLAIDSYQQVNRIAPKRILFFRDGIANNQFTEVSQKEVAAVKAAIAKRKLTDCKLTFMVVQKRHHLRLFPIDQNADRSGNCLPGTVIGSHIVHPTQFQFVLQSHAGLQGMSRPTIYTVLHDESRFSSDQLQQLCFNLCFLAERATRSIAMVSPAYRAHIAAFYARMFLEGELSDTGSVSSGGSGETKITFRNVVHSMQQSMYYM